MGKREYKNFQKIEFRVFDASANVVIEKSNFVKETFLHFAITGGLYSFCFYSIPLKEPSKQGHTFLKFKFLKGSQTHLYLGKEEELATMKELRRQFKYPLRDLEDQAKEMYLDYVGMIEAEKNLLVNTERVSDYVLILFATSFLVLLVTSFIQLRCYNSYFTDQKNKLPN